MSEVAGNIVVGVCGGSGSGKTTLAHLVVEKLGPSHAAGLAFDSYYNDHSHLDPADRAEVNYDHPNSLDGELLGAHLAALTKGSEIAVPVYDFATHTRTGDVEIIEPKPIVVVDGILLLAYADIRSQLHLSVYRECPEKIRFARRQARDVSERGRTPESVAAQFAATVQPMHTKFVEPSKDHADIIIGFDEDLDRACDRVVESIRRLAATQPEN